MPLQSAENLVGEAAFTRVAPLAQAPELAVIQPLHHRFFVGIVHAGDLELAGRTSWNLLGVGKAHAFALGCLGLSVRWLMGVQRQLRAQEVVR